MPEGSHPELPKLRDEDLPEGSILKGLHLEPEDYRWFGEQIRQGQPLKPRQIAMVLEYVLQGLHQQALVDRYCAAFAFRELEQRKMRGVTLSAEEEALLNTLQKIEKVRNLAVSLFEKKAQKREEHPLMSIQECTRRMQGALRMSQNFDAAVRHAEEALKLYRQSPEILQWAATCYGLRAKRTGSLEQRITDATKAIDLFEECLVLLRSQQQERNPLYGAVSQARLSALQTREELEKEYKRREGS
jgi:tetratricopeptide (TPR) repeat protein